MELLVEKWQCFDYEEITSTNDVAAKIKLENPMQKIVITAERQTKGRGRRGRNWVSEYGNLFFSQLFRTDISLSHLAFITSLSVAQTIINLKPQGEVKLKWPNDVLINGKKVCGILIESQLNGDAIIGIGVNLISVLKTQELLYPITSLSEVGINISRKEFIKAYLSHFESNLKQCQNEGFAKICIRWQDNAYKLGQMIIINQEKGIFKGIDENGFLLLEQENKIVKFSVGDVTVTEKG